MKNILVIGGSYFAGRILVEELAKHKDFAIHLFNRGRVRLDISGVSEYRGDREEPSQVYEAIPAKEWDALIDFCAYTPEHIETILNYVPGQIKQYLFISTTTIYQNSWEIPIREEAPKVFAPQPELGALASYGYDKWRAEQVLMEICERHRIPYTILRPAIIYGFYNYAYRERYFFDLIRKGYPIVIPDVDLALFNFIWVVDMAHMIIRCIGNDQVYNQEYNLASDELISYSRIVDVLEQIAGKKIKVIGKPVQEIIAEGLPLPFPLKRHLVYSGSKLQRVLDFDYTPIQVGLYETYNYYQMVTAKLQGG